MKKVVISSDSCVDEFKSELKKQEIHYMPMVYVLDKEYKDNFDMQAEYDNFYENMKKGAMPTTSMLNAYEMEEYFKNLLKEHQADIVHISLSSGLSGTYDNTVAGAKEAQKAYPEHKIYVVDSLAASQGQNILVRLAKNMRDQGKSAKQIFDTLEAKKYSLQQWFLIDDLYHLKRGGRISGAKAAIGTLLQTKPILYVNSIGKLEIREKAIGRKKAVKQLSEKAKELGLLNDEGSEVFIAHANCMEDAQLLEKFIKQDFDKVSVHIKNIGPVLGTHSGPGALTLMFLGNKQT